MRRFEEVQRELVPLLTIGRGGVTAYGSDGTSWSQGYIGHVWSNRVGPDTVVIDSRPIADLDDTGGKRDIVAYAFAGPMVNPTIPAGMVQRFGILADGIQVLWNPEPLEGGHPLVGNARALDKVAVDVQARIAEAFGAVVLRGQLPADVLAAEQRGREQLAGGLGLEGGR